MYKKVELTKIKGRSGNFDVGTSRIGWETERPVVGKRYFIHLKDKKIFRTGVVRKFENDRLYTANSIYTICVIEEG